MGKKSPPRKPNAPVRSGKAGHAEAPARKERGRDLDRRLQRIEEENRALRARLEILSGSQNVESNQALRVNLLTQEFNTLDLDRIGEVAVTKIPAVVRARLCSVYVFDYGTNELTLLAQNGTTPLPERVPIKTPKTSVMGRVLQSRE